MKHLNACLLLLVIVMASSFNNISSDVTRSKNGYNANTVFAGFDFFRTHRQGKDGITATWGYSGGTITGYIVERTYEDATDPYASWETVAIVAHTGARSYKVTNTNVTPGFISYRVRVMNGNTEIAVSPVSTEHIVAH
ncbi:MAG TPA: hypothetical protein PLU11_00260 [Chitinophagaceae bacterium]|jgi:hypothetical protein|nr:hypothetical protein [Chitinophagaceae bacterium]HPH30881.1 hypothetical protein [Chitinophagaceae bacterium]HPN57562.1 hypothetical protein [Chitinophagaceae bacterium]